MLFMRRPVPTIAVHTKPGRRGSTERIAIKRLNKERDRNPLCYKCGNLGYLHSYLHILDCMLLDLIIEDCCDKPTVGDQATE